MGKVLANNNVTCFDVDDTLVIWPKDFRQRDDQLRKEFSYGGETVFLEEHSYHTVFLKNCKMRGDLIVVWSANGHAWAEQVVRTLNLTDYVDVIMTKPVRHVDDKETKEAVVGPRVFIPHLTYEKKR